MQYIHLRTKNVARIRTVKPEFWTDEKVVELSYPARLLFIGLWNFCDDDGRMVYSPKRIKMQIFPADNLDISELFGELRGASLVHVYSIENTEYLQIRNFNKHQKVDKRTASKHPCPPNHAESPRIPPTDSIKEGIKEGIKETTLSSDARLVSDVQAIFSHWQTKLNHPQAKLSPERQSKIKLALKNYSASQLCEAIDGCSVTPHNMGLNDRGEVYDDICLILRDASHIERFMRNAANPPQLNGGKQPQPGKMARAAEALRKHNEHNRAFADSATTKDRGAGALPHAGPPARLRTERG